MIPLVVCAVLVFSTARPPAALADSLAAGSATQDASGTISWNNPQNGEVSDSAFASAGTSSTGTFTTNYIQFTNFGFAIAPGATIKGISASFDRKFTKLPLAAGTCSVTDNSVRLLKSGVATGNDNSAGATWPSTQTVATFGSTSDLWGTTWTPSDIMDANFGVELKANLQNTSCSTIASNIDGVTITITFLTANSLPGLPNPTAPSSGATGVSVNPQFQLASTDVDGDYLRYKIVVYQSDCATVVRTIDQTASQTGWSGQDTQASTAYTSGTTATHTYQNPALSGNTTYCWKASAIDPGGSNGFGYPSVRSFTTASTNSAPTTPTLSAPSSGATGVVVAPGFQLSSTDADSDYLQYDIALYQSDCSTLVSDIDQTSSQAGWFGQDANSGAAYASGTTANNIYQSTLSYNTTYCWKARAIDPAGTNTWSSYSATQNFTTGSPPAVDAQINGGTNIRGGTTIR